MPQDLPHSDSGALDTFHDRLALVVAKSDAHDLA